VTIKYYYVNDDTAVLFAGNGTALTGLLVGITNLVPLIKFPIPTFPMWIYFFGLIFAFLSKAMIQLVNDDTFQREKMQNARDVLLAAEQTLQDSDDKTDQLEAAWKLIETQHSTLLNPQSGSRVAKFRALFFFLSAFCFLIATAMLIYFAGFLTTTLP
jgi:hypothetical protein